MSRIIPAGHNAADLVRKYDCAQESDLEKAFLGWLEHGDTETRSGDYDSAIRYLQGIRFSSDDLKSAILNHARHSRIADSGPFISAAYNVCDERFILHDLDIPLGFVGMKLDPHKVIVNTGSIGPGGMAWGGGIFINTSTAGELLGERTEGIVLNYEKAEPPHPIPRRRGILVNIHDKLICWGESWGFCRDDGLQYFRDFREMARDPVALREKYGSVEMLRQDLLARIEDDLVMRDPDE